MRLNQAKRRKTDGGYFFDFWELPIKSVDLNLHKTSGGIDLPFYEDPGFGYLYYVKQQNVFYHLQPGGYSTFNIIREEDLQPRIKNETQKLKQVACETGEYLLGIKVKSIKCTTTYVNPDDPDQVDRSFINNCYLPLGNDRYLAYEQVVKPMGDVDLCESLKKMGIQDADVVPNTEETEVRNLITKFEKYIQDRNVKDLMSLFTPPQTQEEISLYRNLMGQDPDVGAPRLFNNVTSNFIVTSWEIARREYPDNKELIDKINDKYVVIIDETRKSWCNADPCAGTYSFENTSAYILEIVDVNSQWLVDKYYFMNQGNNRTGGVKYEALTF